MDTIKNIPIKRIAPQQGSILHKKKNISLIGILQITPKVLYNLLGKSPCK